MKKAIFFSLDALFGLIIAFGFLSFLFVSMQSSSVTADVIVLDTSQSVLHAAYNADILFSPTQSSLEIFLNTTLPFCGTLRIFDDDLVMIHNATKSPCLSASNSVFVRRSFVYDSQFYIAELEAWNE